MQPQMQYGGPCMQPQGSFAMNGSAGGGGFMNGGGPGSNVISAPVDTGVKFFGGRRHRRMNVLALCLSLFVPWVIFCAVLALLSFGSHYHLPIVTAMIATTVVVGLGALWSITAWQRCVKGRNQLLGNPIDFAVQIAHQTPDQSGDWWFFMLTTALISAIVAVILGNNIFSQHTQPYYDLSNLSVYTGVNPATVHGQELMDAGQVNYMPGTTLDVKRSVGFRNIDTYCVAPIVPADNVPLSSYDFWAVGLNCCGDTDHSQAFQCGASRASQARGGLRVMRNEDRSFYRLAVQQAQSTYNIRAIHPLFFYWVDDPAQETYRYMQEAFRQYVMAMYGHFGVQLLLVVLAASAISVGGGAA